MTAGNTNSSRVATSAKLAIRDGERVGRRTHVLHAIIVRLLSMHPREDGARGSDRRERQGQAKTSVATQ